jgi:hypothetical protein
MKTTKQDSAVLTEKQRALLPFFQGLLERLREASAKIVENAGRGIEIMAVRS